MQLRGRVVVVTGASRGIGAATVAALTARGACVVAVARDAAALDRLAAATGATPVADDVADPAHAGRVVAAARAAHGHVDAVVLNAGIGHEGPFAEMTAERISALLDVDLRAPMLLARAVVPELVDHGSGAVVLVGSIAGELVVPGETVYSAAKAGLAAFGTGLREELRGSGVTVSTVVPGVVATEFFARRGAPYTRSRPRPVPPERAAAAVVRALERGEEQVVVPGWLAVPATLRRFAPRSYRALARRFS